MKIFHFIIGKANKDRPNGVNQVIAGLCKYSSLNGEDIRVIGLASNAKTEGEIISRDQFDVIVYSRWSFALLKEIKESLKWCDLLHIHGIYNWPNVILGKLAKKYLVPYVLTIHDGLAPKRTKYRKKIFDFLIQKKHIESASAIHVLALEEATEILEVCTPKSFIYSPNGIDLDDFPIDKIEIKNKQNNLNNTSFTIGYLGRISEEKNLLNLAKAIDLFDPDIDIKFKIAGPDSNYLNKILSLSKKDNIEWVGPQYGNDKIEFIKSLDLFVHPSEADVFSIAAMEVLAIGTPLMISRASKASHFYNSRGFFMCEPSAYGIYYGIQDVLDKRGEWNNIAHNGQKLIFDTFNWNTASKNLISGYKKLL